MGADGAVDPSGDGDGVACDGVALLLLLAFKAVKELVVKARKRADESAAFEDSINAATADGIDDGRDVGCGCALTVPRGLNIESSKSCLFACFRPALPSSELSPRSCCSCGGWTGPGSG